ncbi:flagellin N-terminal helical domain-containing protein [Halobacillus amylolyticus]|uniref:flagellin N-terminal helical domain-containing protein n=1 Tax=Halobacillus amylolyticus TaxID=2932259 RepID=UPI00273A4AFA|nr:flagellin [Halobacillus amylolyticus]
MIQTAEGALNETHSILQRMRELATQAANDTNTTEDRGEIQKEMNQLTSEINRIGNATEFNTQKLINGDKDATTTSATNITEAANTTGGVNAVEAVQASGEIGTSGITLTATSGGSYDGAAGNLDIEIAGSSGAAPGAAVSGGTLTITLDSDSTMGESAISAALAAGSLDNEFNISGSGTVGATDTGSMTGGTEAVSEVKSSDTFTISTVPSEGDKLTIGSTDVAFYDSTSGTYADATEAATDLGVTATNLIDTNEKSTDQVAAAVAGLTVAEGSLFVSGSDVTFTSSADGTSGDDTTVSYTGVSTTTGGVNLQIGANENQSLTLDIGDMRASALGITGDVGEAGFTSSNTVTDGTNNAKVEAALDVSSHASASAAITKLDEAIESVSSERSKLGAYQNRLDHTINNLGTSSENLTAAESRIRDVDYDLVAA